MTTLRGAAQTTYSSIYIGTSETEYAAINPQQNGLANIVPVGVNDSCLYLWDAQCQMELKLDETDEIVDNVGNRFWGIISKKRRA